MTYKFRIAIEFTDGTKTVTNPKPLWAAVPEVDWLRTRPDVISAKLEEIETDPLGR